MKTWWQTPDGLAVLLSGILFLGTGTWAVLNESTITQLDVPMPKLTGGVTPSGRVLSPAENTAPPIWSDPAEGAESDAWIFDVFTPPVIYYDRETGRFSVSAPEVLAPTEDLALSEPFGLNLERVVREPFRLQLIGYAGTVEEPIGIFENVTTTDGIVAREGHLFADLDLELRRLVVQREDLIVPDSMPLREIVAVAEIWDSQRGAMVRLTSNANAWATQPKAEVILADSGERRLVEAGDQWETPAGVFRITGVFFSPDSVTVTKRLPGGTQETARLMPNSAAFSQFDGDSG